MENEFPAEIQLLIFLAEVKHPVGSSFIQGIKQKYPQYWNGDDGFDPFMYSEQARKEYAAVFDKMKKNLNVKGKTVGIPLIFGTAGEMNGCGFQDLFYDPEKYKLIDNASKT
jgi:hypothetical protein